MNFELSSTVTLERRDNIALLRCDNPPVNAISHSIRAGLVEGVRRLNEDDELDAAIIICKGKSFFVGADIAEFGKISSSPSWSEFDRSIDMSPKPIIAAIHGKCLGGGFELALACHYRIAVADAEFGFPEVKLGLIPGSGGTQRLPRLVGFEAALDLIASGRSIGASKAQELGIIRRIAKGTLEDAALALAQESIQSGMPSRRARDMDKELVQARRQPSLFTSARETIAKRQRGMKAPLLAVQAIENSLFMPFDDAMRAEAELFVQCQKTEEHRALSHLFFAEREARRIPDLPRGTPERDVRSVAVVGGGTMGSGIALAFADAGLPVCLVELSQPAAESAKLAIRKELDRSIARGRLSDGKAADMMSLIETASELRSASGADVVVEAVFENMDIKRKVFRGLDSIMKRGAILASNTSSLDLDEIAISTRRPQDVIGLHFFSPPNVMKLVEIIRGKHTSNEVLATAITLAKRIGKQPVVARVCEGFIVNRAFRDYWRESRYLVEEGASPYEVDEALVAFGMPQGPFAVSDLVGLDVSKMIRANRRKLLGTETRHDTLEDELADTGRLGRKNSIGWYRYAADSQRGSPDDAVLALVDRYRRSGGVKPRKISTEEIVERCIYCVINEGAKELEEGIAIRASDIDVAAVMGYGFPAYRGGPMHYAETVGLQQIVSKIKNFYALSGDHWELSPLLGELARTGRGFRPDG